MITYAAETRHPGALAILGVLTRMVLKAAFGLALALAQLWLISFVLGLIVPLVAALVSRREVPALAAIGWPSPHGVERPRGIRLALATMTGARLIAAVWPALVLTPRRSPPPDAPAAPESGPDQARG